MKTSASKANVEAWCRLYAKFHSYWQLGSPWLKGHQYHHCWCLWQTCNQSWQTTPCQGHVWQTGKDPQRHVLNKSREISNPSRAECLHGYNNVLSSNTQGRMVLIPPLTPNINGMDITIYWVQTHKDLWSLLFAYIHVCRQLLVKYNVIIKSYRAGYQLVKWSNDN